MGRTTTLYRAARPRHAARAPAAETANSRPAATAGPAPLVALQQSVGNRAVGRLIQVKLRVGRPDDEHEQEEDGVAEQVSAMPAHPDLGSAPPQIQRFSEPSDRPMDPAPASVGQVLASPGRPLETALRQDEEERFGHDFSRVRVHTDAKAAESARAVSARAYTVGHDIVFAAGQYDPGGEEGRELLAHELAHTIQQSASASAAVPLHQPIRIEPPGTSLEQAAEECSTRFTSDAGALAPIHRIALQRQPAPPPKTEKAEESGEPLFALFVADESKRRDKRYARRQAQGDAARIRRIGTLSSEDRQLVRAKLRFFEGDAWETYGQEIRPALMEVTAGGRQQSSSGVPVESKLEKQRNYEAMLAYYSRTRQSQLDLLAASRAKFREQIHNMSAEQIHSQWEAGKEAFDSVASSPGHRLQAKQLFQIWLRH